MSMMGEMTFFLRLQVNQSPCGIFINQSKYVLEFLNKYGMESYDPVGTLIEIKEKLDLDQNGTPVDAMKYRSMIGALMYLTSSRPDIVHTTCLCARYQAKPTEKHLKDVKRIFRYLWGTVNTGLCLSPKELERLAKSQARGIYPGTLPLDRVEVLGNITLSWKPCQGGSSKIEPTWSQIRQQGYNLTPAESKFKTHMLDHQDKCMMKAQVHVSKYSVISDKQPLPLRKHYCQIYQVVKHMLRRRLLASFQDREHEGGNTRSQGDIKDNDIKIKIQDHNMHMISQRNS
nr:copia protein [Tanacetum cinerariifolium]